MSAPKPCLCDQRKDVECLEDRHTMTPQYYCTRRIACGCDLHSGIHRLGQPCVPAKASVRKSSTPEPQHG